jgi:hypothetical protein
MTKTMGSGLTSNELSIHDLSLWIYTVEILMWQINSICFEIELCRHSSFYQSQFQYATQIILTSQ